MESLFEISPELMALLRCPLSRLPLTQATGDLLSHLDGLRLSGALRDRGGRLVSEPLIAGLLSGDGRTFYPIREGFPVLIVDESIEVS